MKWIDAEQKVNITIFDEQTDDRKIETMTIEEILDTYTDEGCPEGWSDFECDWIPCSKKKPKIGIDVLIRFERNCAVGFYSNGSWNINSGNGYYTGLVSSEDQPIAWKPLPEPWEGEQE